MKYTNMLVASWVVYGILWEYMPIRPGVVLGVNGAAYMAVPWSVWEIGFRCVMLGLALQLGPT